MEEVSQTENIDPSYRYAEQVMRDIGKTVETVQGGVSVERHRCIVSRSGGSCRKKISGYSCFVRFARPDGHMKGEPWLPNQKADDMAELDLESPLL